MTIAFPGFFRLSNVCIFALVLTLGVANRPAPADAQVTAFKQAIAEAAYSDDDIAAHFRDTDYAPLWSGSGPVFDARRSALISALDGASAHGLSPARYNTTDLLARMRSARSARDLGLLEVELSEAFLRYARDVQTGTLVPSRIDKGIVREIAYRDRAGMLAELARSDAGAYFRSLPPETPQYRALMKQKMELESLVAQGGWGKKVPENALKPGQKGSAVIALRNRLIDMGYLDRTASAQYDSAMEKAVRAFQESHGLSADGVAGKGTIAQINVSASDRLKSVIVAMERERWLNRDLGERHVLVNQTDFTARIVDGGEVTFETRSVIGKNTSDRRSPEFSDTMEHMVINPSWYVPRSIVTKEYLPKLRANPNAVGHLEITDSRGRRVGRNTDFSKFSARSFPFAMRQPPGKSNALGLVKFMFPNPYNIYLHDTPQKHLFKREVRAFSHGCIRLADPFDFAYALLAAQEDDPKAYFHRVLNTGRETKVKLEKPIPVHIIYRTAYMTSRGEAEYRRDIYGRDAKIWEALAAAGVVLPAVQG